ncbi:MAG: retention module-containing protein, partial [Methylococcaceae bacterium]|nr:retention module-containing protein [Methylococcaceae bacterium]
MAMEIGIIKILIGEVTVTAIDGTQRALHVGDAVFAGDVITTGAVSAIEIEFADGSIMDLGRSSQTVLNNDVFNVHHLIEQKSGQSDVAAIERALLEGSDPTQEGAPIASGLELGNGSRGIDSFRVEHVEQLFTVTPERSAVDVDAQALYIVPKATAQDEELQNLAPVVIA